VTDAALAAHFDFENLAASGVVRYDRHISMLKIEGFIRAKPRIRHEQNEVVDLLGVPFETTVKWFLGVSPSRLIELLVLFGAKPGPAHHLALCLIGGRPVGKVLKPPTPDGRFKDHAQRHDFIVEGAKGRLAADYLFDFTYKVGCVDRI
jgi:hypothetical protein